MTAKGCIRCLRISLLVSSVLTMLIGDVIVGFGIYCALWDSQQVVREVAEALPTEFFVLKVGLISGGSCIVLMSFWACVGVALKSKCALVLHSILTCLLVLGCSAAAVLSALPDVQTTIQTQLGTSLKRSYGNASLITYAVDVVQSKAKCCGWSAEGSTCDWYKSCPTSCCNASSCNNTNAYLSCRVQFSKYLIAIPLALITCVILSFIHLTCALVLICSRSADQISVI